MKSLGKTLKRKNTAPGQDPNDLDLTKKIFVKHCSTAEVNRKRQKLLVFKGNFAARLATLKNKGQMVETMTRSQQWVDRNLDELFEGIKK